MKKKVILSSPKTYFFIQLLHFEHFTQGASKQTICILCNLVNIMLHKLRIKVRQFCSTLYFFHFSFTFYNTYVVSLHGGEFCRIFLLERNRFLLLICLHISHLFNLFCTNRFESLCTYSVDQIWKKKPFCCKYFSYGLVNILDACDVGRNSVICFLCSFVSI